MTANRWTLIPWARWDVGLPDKGGAVAVPVGLRLIPNRYPKGHTLWRSYLRHRPEGHPSTHFATMTAPVDARPEAHEQYHPFEPVTWDDALREPLQLARWGETPNGWTFTVEPEEWATATPAELVELLGMLWGADDPHGKARKVRPLAVVGTEELARGVLDADGLDLDEESTGRALALLSGALVDLVAELREALDLTPEGLARLWTPNGGWRTDDGMLWLEARMIAEIRQRFGVDALPDGTADRYRTRWEEDRDNPARLLRGWLDPSRWNNADGSGWATPTGWLSFVAGLLWQHRVKDASERADLFARTRTDPTPWSSFPMGADRHAVRIATALTGDPGAIGKGATRDDAPEALVIRWEGGEQLNLPFSSEDDGPFLAVAKQYGPEALAHLWALVLLHWTSGRAPGDPFPWYPSEHLWALGLTDSHAHERTNAILDRFARSSMQVRWADGGFTDPAPLAYVLPGAERKANGSVVAGKMMVHPALTYPAAEGAGWWAADLQLLRAIPRRRAAEAAATPLAVLIAQQWSITVGRKGGPVFTKRIPDLAAAIGRPIRDDRAHDSRTVRDIEAATEALEAVGFVGRFEVSGDVLRAWPSMARGDKPRRPAVLPATGDELAVWLEQRGGTQKSNADALGVTTATLRNGIRRGWRYLHPPLRDRLRAFLWPPPSR